MAESLNRPNSRSVVEQCAAPLRLPQITPGETVPSFMRRAAYLSGYHTMFWVRWYQMGRRNCPLEAMPSPLRKLCEAFSSSLTSAELLLDRGHTLYSYWTCCADGPVRERVRSYLINGHIGPIRPCHLPVNLEPCPYDVFHCPACDEENINERGFAPTLVVHQMPFASVCPKHGVFTREVQNCGLFGHECIDIKDAMAFHRSREFARRSQLIAERQGYSEDMVIDFRTLVREHGFITDNGRVRWQQLLQAYHAFHSQRFSDARLSKICHDDELVHRSLGGLMTGSCCAHPVIYCLARWALDEISPSRDVIPLSPTQCRRELVADQVASSIENYATATSAAQSLGVTTTTFITRALELGFDVRQKPSRLDANRKSEVERLVMLGEQIPNIARELGLSVTSIYRTIRTRRLTEKRNEPLRQARVKDAQERWGAFSSMNPHMTPSEIRAAKPALYATIYRSDRRWFRKQTSALTRQKVLRLRAVRGRSLESQARSAIRAVKLRTSGGKIPRISIRRLASATGLSAHYLESCSGETDALLRQVIETGPEFVERRVCEAAIELGRKLEDCERWRALRHAGLRLTPERLEKH